MAAAYSATVLPSLGCDPQPLHRAHDRDRTPRIAVAGRWNVAVALRFERDHHRENSDVVMQTDKVMTSRVVCS